MSGDGHTGHGLHEDHHLKNNSQQGGPEMERRHKNNPYDSQRRQDESPRNRHAGGNSERGESRNFAGHQGANAGKLPRPHYRAVTFSISRTAFTLLRYMLARKQ